MGRGVMFVGYRGCACEVKCTVGTASKERWD